MELVYFPIWTMYTNVNEIKQRRVRSGRDPEGPPSDAPPSEDRLESMLYDLLDY